MSNTKENRVRLLLNKLTGKESLPGWLHNALALWLVSDDSEEEKDRQLRERFDSEVAASSDPSAGAYRSYRRFARLAGIAQSAPVRMPLGKRAAFRISVAAVAIIAVAMGAYELTMGGDNSTDAPSLAIIQVDGDACRSDAQGAKCAEHTLPDNSTVRLAAGSKLAYDEDFDGERYVELDGRAYFHVTKAINAEDRFKVHTGHFDITVLGTQFEVYDSSEESFSTLALLHGSVSVQAGEHTLKLTPGQHLRYDHGTGEYAMSTVALAERRYARMPELVFNNAPLHEVFHTLETYFGVNFAIDGNIAEDLTLVDGDLSALHSLEQVMSVIRKLSGNFDYSIEEENINIKLI